MAWPLSSYPFPHPLKLNGHLMKKKNFLKLPETEMTFFPRPIFLLKEHNLTNISINQSNDIDFAHQQQTCTWYFDMSSEVKYPFFTRAWNFKKIPTIYFPLWPPFPPPLNGPVIKKNFLCGFPANIWSVNCVCVIHIIPLIP